MKKALIVYWSGTGNTQAMADILAAELKENGFDVTSESVENAEENQLIDYNYILLGCPSMGAEVLEENEMAPFVESLHDKVKDKNIALFGSYDWGDGEWMRNWVEQMKGFGAKVKDPGLIINLEPTGDKEEDCKKYAREIATDWA